VSIAKAGITTTLNARTSVLAAANPLYGRYNKTLSPQANINLPPALLSRFDVTFLLLDEPNVTGDEKLAQHVTYVHANGVHPNIGVETFDAKFIRAYVANAKTFSPVFPKSLHDYIVTKYAEKRNEQKEETREGYAYVTPRTLLGIIRLSQSLAKLRFDNEVNQQDVDEALRLMDSSRSTINEDDRSTRTRTDTASKIYALIRDECRRATGWSVNYSNIERRILN
jgi:DNA replication licensing factor MCM7